MRRTPLIEQHREAEAKLVDFAGWEMPLHYSGVVDEYHAVRTKAGIFDVSHMGRILVTGPESGPFLQRLTTNDVFKLAIGQAHYSMVCNEQGGIKDDVFLYRTGPSEFLLCVNASNREKILDWLKERQGTDACMVEDRSAVLAQIALQGPASREILADLGASDIRGLNLHRCYNGTVGEIPCFIARTGYTGELGYEINVETDRAPALWNRLLESGRRHGLKPAGLGARDLLRLEMAYLLYGNDIGEDTTPLEAGAEWTVSFDKGEFTGSRALTAQQHQGIRRRLIAFELLEKAVPRHGFKILDLASAQPIGAVTSGNLSPILQKGIGLGYVPASHTTVGTSIAVEIRGKVIAAVIVKPPFYKRKT
jgi:aminomethyltransferase